MADDERAADDPGWAAPHLPPRDPASDAPAPGAPAAPPAAAPPPPPPPVPSAAWAQPAPTGAAGAPPGATRRRRPWLVVLISVLAVILVSIVLGTVFFVDRTYPPFDAANDFVNDLANGDLDAAAAQLCAADQSNSDRALSLVNLTLQGGDRVSVNPLRVDRDGDRATVDYTVTEESGEDSIDTYELPLRNEGGDWRPCPGDTQRLR